MSTHRCYSPCTKATSVWTAWVCVCVLQVRYHSDISFTSPCPFDFLCIALPGKLTYSFFYFFFLDPVAFIFLVPFVPLSEIEQKKAHAAELWVTGASKVTNLSGVTSVMERHVMDPVLSWSFTTRLYITFSLQIRSRSLHSIHTTDYNVVVIVKLLLVFFNNYNWGNTFLICIINKLYIYSELNTTNKYEMLGNTL